MRCPTCGEDMVSDYGNAKLLDDEYDYSKKISLMRCIQCGTIVIGDNVIKPKEKNIETSQTVPAVTPAEKELSKEAVPAVISETSVPEEISFMIDPNNQEEILCEEEEPTQKLKKVSIISIKELKSTGHLLSDAWLDTLELSTDIFKKRLYDRLISFERKQERHMSRYIPTKLVVIHDTIINPTICELIKTEEIRIHKQYISKRYYFKSPEGYFFSVAHTMNGVDQATELKLSQVKILFDQDVELYKKYVPENTYKEGYNPIKDGPLVDDTPDEDEESLEALPAPAKSDDTAENSESTPNNNSKATEDEDKKAKETLEKESSKQRKDKSNKKPDKDTSNSANEAIKKQSKASKRPKNKPDATGKGTDSSKDDSKNKAKENESHQNISKKDSHDDFNDEIPEDIAICSGVDDYDIDFPEAGESSPNLCVNCS